MTFLARVDNEASAGAVQQQQLNYRTKTEHPDGARIPGASGNAHTG